MKQSLLEQIEKRIEQEIAKERAHRTRTIGEVEIMCTQAAEAAIKAAQVDDNVHVVVWTWVRCADGAGALLSASASERALQDFSASIGQITCELPLKSRLAAAWSALTGKPAKRIK